MLIISMKPSSSSFIKIKLVTVQGFALTRRNIIDFFLPSLQDVSLSILLMAV